MAPYDDHGALKSSAADAVRLESANWVTSPLMAPFAPISMNPEPGRLARVRQALRDRRENRRPAVAPGR